MNLVCVGVVLDLVFVVLDLVFVVLDLVFAVLDLELLGLQDGLKILCPTKM